MQERMQRVVEKYAAMDKVILVGHRMAFRTICYMEEMRPGEFVECVYEPGQKLCEYSCRQNSQYFWSFQSTVSSLWLFHLPDGSLIRSPFSSRS